MATLSHAQLSAIVEGDISKVEIIDLSGRNLTKIEDLSCCKLLKRIELRNNKLEDLKFVEYNLELKWIDAQSNNFSCHFGNALKNLSQLSVLNLSHNEITNVDSLMDGLGQLKCLVLSDNQITAIQGIAKLQNLETLILSHNLLEAFYLPKLQMPNLRKLSLGNNKIKSFSLDTCVFNLRELRLNGNRLTDVPENLYCCGQLEILDLGKNFLTPPSNMTSAQYCADRFRRCKNLKSLNLGGNTKLAATPNEWDTNREEICKVVPMLQIFNSKNFRATEKKGLKGKNREPRTTERNVNPLQEDASVKHKDICGDKQYLREQCISSDKAEVKREAFENQPVNERKVGREKRTKVDRSVPTNRNEEMLSEQPERWSLNNPFSSNEKRLCSDKLTLQHPKLQWNPETSFVSKINDLVSHQRQREWDD